ncbi:MAG: hypothetical protein KA224_00935 [Steroidobacteraceae bacterium]|nr:hypothetical protein [Steroidobacteraceae bacterium]MCC7199162.1 hypothetical protein [Gammaproteobacteria bacterium]
MSNSRDKDRGDSPVGRILFDARGNAMWAPYKPARTDDTLIEMLKVDELSLSSTLKLPAVEPKADTGSNPYGSSGEAPREPRRKKTDLRALSEHIKLKREMEGGGGSS